MVRNAIGPIVSATHLLSVAAKSSTWRGRPTTNEMMNKQSATTAGCTSSDESVRLINACTSSGSFEE